MNSVCPHCQKPVLDAVKVQRKHRVVGKRILHEIHGQNAIRDNINQRLFLVPMLVTKVAAINGLTVDQLLSDSRRRERVQVRHALMWFLAEHTTLALVTIAGIFGRHHASVIHARKQIPKLLSVGDPDTVATIEMVMDTAAEIWKP